jgi:hypothetical protein
MATAGLVLESFSWSFLDVSGFPLSEGVEITPWDEPNITNPPGFVVTILALTTRPRCWKVREFIGTTFTLFSLGFCYILLDVTASGVKFWLYRDWIPIEAAYVPDLLHVWQSFMIVLAMCVPFVFHDGMFHQTPTRVQSQPSK